MNRLIKVIQRLSLARDLSTIQEIVRKAARELASADGATFVLRDDGKCFYADEDAIAPLWKGKRFPMEVCVSGWVMLNKMPTVIPDIYQDPRIPAAAYRPTFVQSLAMVPIRTLEPIGAIGVYWARNHTPAEQEMQMLQALADSTAVAMENVQVYGELEMRVRQRTVELEMAKQEIEQLSLTDELTQLMNRRGFRVAAEQLLKSAARNNKRVCAIYVDVDGLKEVNDRLGHDIGDQMISDVAKALKETFRASDVMARLGGDEFCVLAVDSRHSPDSLIERIRSNLDSVAEHETRYRLKASIGVASRRSSEESLDELVSRADLAMYSDKRARKSLNVPAVIACKEAGGKIESPRAPMHS